MYVCMYVCLASRSSPLLTEHLVRVFFYSTCTVSSLHPYVLIRVVQKWFLNSTFNNTGTNQTQTSSQWFSIKQDTTFRREKQRYYCKTDLLCLTEPE